MFSSNQLHQQGDPGLGYSNIFLLCFAAINSIDKVHDLGFSVLTSELGFSFCIHSKN